MDWKLLLIIFHSGMIFLLVTIYRQTIENEKNSLRLHQEFQTFSTDIKEMHRINKDTVFNLNTISNKLDFITLQTDNITKHIIQIHTDFEKTNSYTGSIITEQIDKAGNDVEQMSTLNGKIDRLLELKDGVEKLGKFTSDIQNKLDKPTMSLKDFNPLFRLNNEIANMIGSNFYGFSPLQTIKSTVPIAKRVVFGITHEDMRWTEGIDADIDIIAYTHEFRHFQVNGRVFLNTPNTGREGGSYLRHIIDFYDDLADVTLFMHGQGSSWHTKDATAVINNARWTEITDYQPLHHHYFFRKDNRILPNFEVWKELSYVWEKYFLKELKFDIPKEIVHTCCGEFAVSRDLIRSHPLGFYEDLYELVTFVKTDNIWLAGHMMEISWHMIFGKSPRYEKEQLDFCGKVAYCDKLAPDIVRLHTNPLYENK